jgi:hypothetical protein
MKTKKRLSKVMAITVAFIMLFTTVAFANDMADVADSPYSEAINALVEAGVVAGFPDGTFRPFDNLTRAEASIMLVRAINPPNSQVAGTATQAPIPSNFVDMVSGFMWAENYVSFAARHGIVRGFPDGSFRPGSNLTNAELATMILRTIGYTDSQIGPNWPYDNIAKAREVGVLAGLPEELPEVSTREVAAAMIFNKLDELRAIGYQMKEDIGQEVEQEITETGNVPWNPANLIFTTGRFNETMTNFQGVPISNDVEIFTYGIRTQYRQSMELPTTLNSFRRDTVHKYKNAQTPAFYILSDGVITTMILPMDAGFTGRVYGVINDFSNTSNGRGESVLNVHTLAAGQAVAWLTQTLDITRPSASTIASGEVFEMQAQNGAIREIRTAADPSSNNDFRELTPGAWTSVESFDGTNITLDNGNMFEVGANAVVYILNEDGEAYRPGRTTNIRNGSEIRAFVISGDAHVATIITVNN